MPQILSILSPKLYLITNQLMRSKKIIKSLQTKNSHGYDEISVKILKLSALIINKSLSSHIFPTRSKFSIVKAVFKNGHGF
jgi:hypothetical protein